MPPRYVSLALLTVICAACGGKGRAPTVMALLPPGLAQVAQLPDHFGLQYCVNVRAGDLAPPHSRNIFLHSISVWVTTTDRNVPAYIALAGRYPGWDTPGTTIYNQPFTNTNAVWLEIIHEFPLGMACVEAYGRGLRPSRYSTFSNKMLLAYTYLSPGQPGISTQKFFPVHWGPYLRHYSPHHRPKH